MATKRRIKSIVAGAAVIAAAGVGQVVTPEGQASVKLISDAVQAKQEMVAKKPAKKVRAKKQTQQTQKLSQTVNTAQSVYLPWRPGQRVWGKLTMSPKEYGEYLLMTGKRHHNVLRNKRLAKI